MSMEEKVKDSLSVSQIAEGFAEAEEGYCCSFCRKEFQKGKIYEAEGELYDAYGMVRNHIEKQHGSAVDYLLGLDPGVLGISEVQQKVLRRMADGKNDKEIAQELGIVSSTVRNHRFKLREKQKQAKLYLALMEALEGKTHRPINQSDQGMIAEASPTARQVDDRYVITETERQKTITTYMDKNGSIKQFPVKEKKKLILLREVMKSFESGREYNEKEVNKILKPIFKDFSTIRRALIEYGFLERSADCSVYRVKL